MKIYPVVHITTVKTSVAEGIAALDAGADGIFLINHNGGPDKIFQTMKAIRTERPGSFVGVNLLEYTTKAAFDLIESKLTDKDYLPQALWVDDVTYSGRGSWEVYCDKNRHPDLCNIQLFGGIAFKYTSTFTEDPTLAAQEVISLRNDVDVVTTSGAGTGTAPTVAKLHAVKQAAGDKPVAVASGISIENIVDIAHSVDFVLISTSIETHPGSGIFNKEKLNAVIEVAHSI